MTAEVVVFCPRADVDAIVNLTKFIEMAKTKLIIFGNDLVFDDMTWDVTDAAQLKGQKRKRVRIYFSTQETVDEKPPTQMPEPFVSFAKAYVRYMQGMRSVKNISARVAALRALEVELRKSGHSNPVKVDGETFNRAAQVIKGRFAEDAAYRVGIQLQLVAEFMSEHNLTTVPLMWRSFLSRPGDTTRVGAEFDKRREEKMPSLAALESLPKAFKIASQPQDVIFSSVAAILCSAPDRINEVLLLFEDCEKGDPINKEDPYGIKWIPAKGAEPTIKWIIPSMVPVVAEAVGKLRRLTEPARNLARWYESNPGKMYLPLELEHFRNKELLTIDEIRQVLFSRSDTESARRWCRDNKLPLVEDGRRRYVRFVDVEKKVLEMLPPGFPILNEEIGLKYSDALLIIRRNQLHKTRGTFDCIIEPVDINQVNSAIGSKIEHGFPSIFSRLGFTEPDGSPIKMTTHQFRHYLNTLAQAGGMSQLDIAKWSGRVDVRQNQAYDHISAHQMVAKIRQAIGDESQMFGPLAELPKKTLISRDKFGQLKIPTAHTTDFGFCVHDYTMMPCEENLDCINCHEHVCVKGDAHKTAMIKRRLMEEQYLLAKAKAAIADSDYGADRWMECHQMTIERLTQIVEILDNPDVPDGSIIQLTDIPDGIRSIEQSIQARTALDSPAQSTHLKSGRQIRIEEVKNA